MHDEFTTLHFAYAADAPSLDAFDVKTVTPAELLDAPAALTVIGESHYVGLPSYDFHEVCSCKPLSVETAYTVPLEPGAEKMLSFETDVLDAETAVEVSHIDAFPGAEETTASYRFGPDAWTTITVREPDSVGTTDAVAPTEEVGDSPPRGESLAKRTSYETYHTYPEYEIAVYTETQLTETPERVAEKSESIPSPNDD